MGWGEAHQLRSLCDHEDPCPRNMMPSSALHAYVHIHSHRCTHVYTHAHTLIHVHTRTHLHESFWRQNRRILNSELIWTTLAAWGFRLDPKYLPPPKKRKYSLLTINLVNRRKYTIEMCLVKPTHNSKTREAEAGDWGQPGLQNNPLTHAVIPVIPALSRPTSTTEQTQTTRKPISSFFFLSSQQNGWTLPYKPDILSVVDMVEENQAVLWHPDMNSGTHTYTKRLA